MIEDKMENVNKNAEIKVAIIGGGLVGALNACFLARRGYHVDVYESREDFRQNRLTEAEFNGRSINMALSVRGLSALRAVGLADRVLDHAIPVYARMIHDVDGKQRAIPYGTRDQCIYSIERRYLNEVLLNEAESFPNVTLQFNRRLINVMLRTGDLIFRDDMSEEIRPIMMQRDVVLGCDGAFSTVRTQMSKEGYFFLHQKYIEHGYVELAMPPTADGNFSMEKNYLHIWPRGNFMLIALPNRNCSFTVTLFMPLEKFTMMITPQAVLAFFEETFPDALKLIGESQLINTYWVKGASYLLTVKCNPYHFDDKVLIMGDAAHAMVPFYGQGMNAGFEDCLIFDQLMTEYDCDLGRVFKEFTTLRNPDAEAICDLALYNYVEMRHLVNTRQFLIRKTIDKFLNWCFPDKWVPLYTMVTFTRTRYHLCIAHREWQDKVLKWAKLALTLAVGLLAFGAYHQLGSHFIGYFWKHATSFF